MKVTILGCGPSGGVPLSCGVWGNCDPTNPKNYRTRTSAWVELDDGTSLLIDVSPDIRQQLLRESCDRVDFVLLTHDHFDHTGGLDDLRPFFYHQGQKRIPVYSNRETIESLHTRFAYMFTQKGESASSLYAQFIETYCIDYGFFDINGTKVKAFKQDHGSMATIGYRIGNVAYSTDVKSLTEDMEKSLHGLDVWLVDCMSLTPKPTHSHLEQTLEWIERFSPKMAYLIHMDPSIDYDHISRLLPSNVFASYDGLCINLG
jgi:phosphoribosyl 1,2-cyclic phosphate phosphodiesterase